MKLILIRHGETYANSLYNTDQRILIGAHDAPVTTLNETGKAQAGKARQLLAHEHIDEIYASDLIRTKQTAELIFPAREIQTTPLLRERSLGSDEGRRALDVFANEDAWKYHVNLEKDSLSERMSKRVPDGENYLMVMERCKTFLNPFDFKAEKTIAVIAHFHLIRCLIYTLLQKEADMELFQIMIPNAEPIIFEYDGRAFHLLKS